MIDQWSFTAPFEGIVPHLYLDSVGVVTCGVGFAVRNTFELQKLPWSPSPLAAVADYGLVSGAATGHAAAFYAQFCKARLRESDMRRIFAERVDGFRRGMRDWRLERFPEPVQLALVDMAYNLGVGGLNKYVRMRAALETGNYRAAAEECSRRGVQQARNDATRGLFLSAGS